MVQEGDSESGWDFIEGDEGEGYRVLLDMKVRLP